MAKESGIGDGLLVHGYDMSGDTGSVQEIGGGPSPLDVTGIDVSAFERLGGVRDGRLGWTSWFNPTRAHARLSLLPTTDVIITYLHTRTLGAPAACLNGKQVNYDGTRGADGSFSFALSAVGNSFGLEWGVQVTAGLRTDTVATNGTSVDTLAAASFGAQAYLQVTAFTGTSVTCTVEDSADNVSFATVAGLAFTAATAITAQRLATSNTATVRRYLRVATTGTFSNAVFSVVVNKNTILGVVF